jgi:hypothetical protein
MPAIIWALTLAMLSVDTAYAQVYKCKTAKNVIVYSDTACSPGSEQSLPDIQSSPSATLIPGAPVEKDAITRQMDAAVKNAIAVDDLIRARALATTAEQKSWVRSAEKEASSQKSSGRNADRDYLADRADSAECKAAKRDVEEETAGNRDPVILSAKTNLMRVACGMGGGAEPPINYGYGRGLTYPYSSYPYGHHQGSPGYRPPLPGSAPVPPPVYDRYRYQPPFGSRFIRPEDGVYR